MKLFIIVVITIAISFIIDYALHIKSNTEEGLEQLYLKVLKIEKIEGRLNDIENNIMTEMACLAAKIDNDIKNIKYEPSVETVDKTKEYSIDQLIEENERLKKENKCLKKENENLKEENKILKRKYCDVCKKYLKIVYPHHYLDIDSLKW